MSGSHVGLRFFCFVSGFDFSGFVFPPGAPDVSPVEEFGCPACRGHTWVFAFSALSQAGGEEIEAQLKSCPDQNGDSYRFSWMKRGPR